MINRHALIVVLAAAAAIPYANAFAPSSPHSTIQRSIGRTTSLNQQQQIVEGAAQNAEEDIEKTRQIIMDCIQNDDDSCFIDDSPDEVDTPPKMIMDIPPTPVAPAASTPAATKKAAPKKKKGGVHKEGVFSPIVVAAGAVLGEDQLNKVRAKVITLHSDIIKSFVDTSDSAFGRAVLRQLFNVVDADNSGYLDKSEVATALNLLGFKWLKEKHVEKIFERADANGDLEISMEEFVEEAPRTLKTNLVKLAKNNGGDMGLLV